VEGDPHFSAQPIPLTSERQADTICRRSAVQFCNPRTPKLDLPRDNHCDLLLTSEQTDL